MTGADVRVLTYNVLSLRLSYDAVVSVITACTPDVVCLQEVPRFLFWRRRLRRLAADADLRWVAGHGRAGAVAVLVSRGVDVIEAASVRLPWQPGRHRRGVAVALLAIGQSRLAVASVHMSLYADERGAHLPLVRAAAERYGVPAVIAGDLNEDDRGALWRLLASDYQDAYVVAPEGAGATFTALDPRRRIDGVFVDPRVAVLGCGVPEIPGITAASDHRPTLARLRLPV